MTALAQPPATPMDLPRRAAMVRQALEEHELDALVVTDLTSVRWLSGFTGSHGLLSATADALTLFTDGRYADQGPAQVAEAGAEVVIGTDLVAGLAAAVHGERIGLEAGDISWAMQRRLTEALDATLVPTTELLVGLRARKDAGELARIEHAAAITDHTLADVVPMLGEGVTEREVGRALDAGVRALGATNSAYETIVASGPNGALPHARPTDRVIGNGDLVVIDVGALYDGYRSDMTRTFLVGEATDVQRRQVEVVREAQAAGVAAVRAGVAVRDIDAACREVIAEAGWQDRFTHGTGHGVGLDIHEHPRLNSRSDDVLDTHMVVTVEPGVYLPGEGGVRWEDLLIVTDDGSEPVTHSPKDPYGW